MTEKRVVVTGLGVVSPLGNKDALWENLKAGVSGIGEITSFDTTAYATKIAGEVKGFRPEDYLDKKELRRMDAFCHYAVAAAKDALKDANLTITEELAPRVGVIVGSGIGGIQTLEKQAEILRDKGPSRVSPFFVPMLIPDMASGQVAIVTGAKGPNSCTVTACATGTHSIGDAFRIIARGQADVMIAGGAEAAVSPLGMAGFVAARALSTRNSDPTKASRPFDQDRDGFVMAEGAATLVLESLDHARARGATIYGEIVGYGASGDAYHITSPAPEGEGANRAIREALADAKILPSDIQYINAHGTSTEYNDLYETMAIHAVFNEHVEELYVTSTKALTGHLLGAAGAIEAVICLLSLKHQTIIGTFNLENQDPNCNLNCLPNKVLETPLTYVLSNSFGFGGHNGVLVFRHFEG